MIYGYIRVSTDKQTTENQRFEIQNYLKLADMIVSEWINETISGKVSFRKRKIGGYLNKMKRGDILICSELSRLGRNIMDIMTILNFCMERGILVQTVKEKYNLGQDLNSKILAFAFGLAAEIERVLISQRTQEALRMRKSIGKHIGRPFGSKNRKRLLEDEKDKIEADLLKGETLVKLARKYKVSYSTMQKFVKMNIFI
ncbi:MAG: recombinase family protein [Alphaproteobacteria bacterium]|nr:recombinase family protein [Alphaproteobacteria bacterium]